MSEKSVQEALQDLLQSMPEFADADVVINDWRVFDQYVGDAPYAIIANANDFRARQDTKTANTKWFVPVALVMNFVEWDTTMNALRDLRQAVVDLMNTSDSRSADGQNGVTIDLVRSDTPITPWYPPYTRAEDMADAVPQFIFQRIILEVEEW